MRESSHQGVLDREGIKDSSCVMSMEADLIRAGRSEVRKPRTCITPSMLAVLQR